MDHAAAAILPPWWEERIKTFLDYSTRQKSLRRVIIAPRRGALYMGPLIGFRRAILSVDRDALPGEYAVGCCRFRTGDLACDRCPSIVLPSSRARWRLLCNLFS